MTGSQVRDRSTSPCPATTPRQRQPDITLARSKLGWEPEIQLEQGLEKTIAYFQSLLAEQ